ncbi:MAG: 23S rRNA (uracil(1939)-C(5))-methyltransferase RlmD [Clostridiales bacterium]|nr:23S rRNA (uracil(1939)-C(5))-methyltransferase RlmD [Clostridiales bacterium]
MEKNDIITALAVGFGSNGEGIVRYGEYTVFVPFLMPGEKANIRILKVKGSIAYGKVEEVITPEEERVRPACRVFGKCGGCQMQHVRYSAQLRFKTGLVKDTLRKIAGIDFPVQPCEKSEKEYAYRNKLQLPIGRKNGVNVIGFYAEHSHRIVEITECPIHPEWAGRVISCLHRYMGKFLLKGYDDETGEGDLRHIVVRELKGKYIVVLVATKSEVAGLEYFMELLDGVLPEYSLFINVNNKPTNVILGEEFIRVKGKGFYNCTEFGITFEAGALTFVQVNERVRGKLYESVAALFEEGEKVIDCYAGGGLLTAMLAKKCGKAYGIEIVPEASICADRLRESNELFDKMENICGKVEEKLAGILKNEPNAAVVLDPPRSGVERSVLKELMAQNVQKIVMISCNPATLARDIGILTGNLIENEAGELKKVAPQGNYEIAMIKPFDMFPQTKHVETLVMLNRKNA